MQLQSIGTIRVNEEEMYIELLPQFKEGLAGLEGFSHVQVFWWFSGCDNAADRSIFSEQNPYNAGPKQLGIFATRSPHRPNPIALSSAYITYIDIESGRVGLAWIDALDGTPVLDLKPYHPSVDRSESASVPDWCTHWPKSIEESADFDWSTVFGE